jgi:hypothetical protein
MYIWHNYHYSEFGAFHNPQLMICLHKFSIGKMNGLRTDETWMSLLGGGGDITIRRRGWRQGIVQLIHLEDTETPRGNITGKPHSETKPMREGELRFMILE